MQGAKFYFSQISHILSYSVVISLFVHLIVSEEYTTVYGFLFLLLIAIRAIVIILWFIDIITTRHTKNNIL